MPKVHFVAKSRKAHKEIGVKKGEPYFWWKKRLSVNGAGIVVKSKERPRQSQLTSSPFWSAVYATQERAEDGVTDLSDVESLRDDLVSDLEMIRDECQEKFDNMPEGLQQGDTGQMLEERVSAMEEAISELEGVDCDDSVDADPKDENYDDERQQKLDDALSSISDALQNISCS